MGLMQGLTDEELVERWHAEHDEANAESFLAELFRRHQTKVAAWCYQITGDVNSAADLAQEVFFKAFQGLQSFRKGSKFTTWLYSIARNRCLDELRSRKRRVEEASEAVTEDLGDWRTDAVDSAFEQRQAADLMRQFVRESLDETESKVMILHYVEELPLDSINRLLGLTNTSGAKAYIVSARRKLKRAHELWKNARRVKAGKHVE
jgi:RNA polymerase sigma-70 factor (ECF subfamily)